MHRTIGEAPKGEAIAALKLYIGFCLKANYGEKDGLPKPGCVRISLSQLEQLADLSRPMVVAGLKLLKKWSMVESLGGRPAIYHIVEYETTRNWTKLTNRSLYGSYSFSKKERDRMLGLEHMSNRSTTTLHALQLYLYLASMRNQHTNKAQVGYNVMCRVLEIQRNWLSAAISMLSTDLITVRTAPTVNYEENKKHSTNHYWLRGSLHDPYVRSLEEFVKPSDDDDDEGDDDIHSRFYQVDEGTNNSDDDDDDNDDDPIPF